MHKQMTKKKLVDYIFYNHGHFFSKTKGEFHQLKKIGLRKFVINKY